MNEDIAPLLPDDRSEAAKDFALLQKTPFANKVLINLRGSAGTSKKELTETADRMSLAMTLPYFTRAVSGPSLPSPEGFQTWFTNVLPQTFTSDDTIKLQKALTAEEVRPRLQSVYTQLTGPEGWFMKPLLQSDPLDLKSTVLAKLSHMNVIPGMALYNNHFISPDGKNTLIIAETPLKMTDSKGSNELAGELKALITKVVPNGIEASVISSHAYTTANAEAIKKDLYVILTSAGVVIFLLDPLFLEKLEGYPCFSGPFFGAVPGNGRDASDL